MVNSNLHELYILSMCKYTGNLFCDIVPHMAALIQRLCGIILFPTALRILGSCHYIFVNFICKNVCNFVVTWISKSFVESVVKLYYK